MPDKHYTKVEEEIIQILDRMESEKPATTRPNLRLVESGQPQSTPTRRRSFRPALILSRVTSGRPWIWIAAAVGFAFAALLIRDNSQNVAMALAIASIVAFLAPIFVGRRGTNRSSTSIGEVKQWRGRDVSLEPPSGPSPAERVSRWFNDRRGGGPRV